LKILLANSPWYKKGFYGVRAGSRWPHFELEKTDYMPFPFFLAYAQAILKKSGFDSHIIDGIAERITLDDFYGRLGELGPDVVVYEVSTPSIDHDIEVAGKTKEMLGDDTVIVFCGPHHGMYSEEFLRERREVDYCLQGEYEYALLELLERMRDNKPIDDLQSLIHRDRDGNVRINPRRPIEKDLDRFPWPSREDLPMSRYHDVPGGIPEPSLQMWASRGCPYRCIFCSWPQIMYTGSSYRVRDVKDVAAEIKWCVEKFGFKSVYFDDDTFNIGKPRILSLCDEIKKSGLKIPWAIMARADCMDREMLEAMVDAGLVALKYGVESGVQEILDSSGKSLDLKKVKETVRFTRELCVKYHLTFTFGLPGETFETIKKTIDLALELDPDSLQFSIITPYPGSAYFEQLESKGYILSKKWDEYDGYNKAVIRTDNLTAADLEKALKMAAKRWRGRVISRNIRKDPIGTSARVIKKLIGKKK